MRSEAMEVAIEIGDEERADIEAALVLMDRAADRLRKWDWGDAAAELGQMAERLSAEVATS